MKLPVVVIVGPTASGKTELAKQLAKKFNGELIGADSRQVYKFLDIGTAKDKTFKQHLVDELDPRTAKFTAVEFLQRAKKLIEQIHARGKLPIVVGGTGLYIDALLKGYHFPRGKRYRGEFRGQATPLPYRFLILGIKLPRDELYQNISMRSHKMVEGGLIDETRRLLKLLPKNHELLKTIGYQQAVEYLDHKISKADLAAAITRATKVFVRHQANWLKRWPVVWVSEVGEVVAALEASSSKHLQEK